MLQQIMPKFRTWDSQQLTDAVKVSLQIRAKIEEMCITHRISPNDLPNSLIPTDNLYSLVCAYEASYNALIENDLLKSGNLKTDKHIH
jgi:hypothetical protein